MKTKQLLVLIAIVVVLALVAWWKNHSSEATWQESRSEDARTILPVAFDTEAIAAIVLKKGDATITLKKESDGWKMADRYGYPANLQEMSQLVTDLTNTRLAQILAVSSEQANELQLDDSAATVSLLDKNGSVLSSIAFGKKAEKESEQPASPMMYGMGGPMPIGRYVKLGDGTVALVSNTFALVDEPISNWFDKEFFKISNLKSATLARKGEPVWTVSRENASGDLAIVGDIPAEKEPDTSKLSAIKNAFSWIRFNDVADPKAEAKSIGMDEVSTLSVTDFDGNAYVLTFGKPVDGKQYLKVTTSWHGATVRTPGKDEKPEDKAKLDADFAKKVKESQDKATELNARLSPWVYEVGTSALSAVNLDLNGLLKDKPKPAEPAKKAEDAKNATPPAPPTPPPAQPATSPAPAKPAP